MKAFVLLADMDLFRDSLVIGVFDTLAGAKTYAERLSPFVSDGRWFHRRGVWSSISTAPEVELRIEEREVLS